MGKKKKNTTDPCERVLAREEKLEKLELIYSKAISVMFDALGNDKDSVYAAAQAIQTASREIGMIERVISLNQEVEAPVDTIGGTIGWGSLAGSEQSQPDA